MKKNRLLWIMILLIVSCVFFSLSFYHMDSDYLWHIKAGYYMFLFGPIKYDVFSWSVFGKYWMSHEWLFEYCLYYLKLAFGDYHIFLYCFSCLLFLGLFPFLTNRDDYMKNIPFSLCWIFFFLLSIVNVQARPHLLSYCFLSFTIYLLRDYYLNPNSKKIWFLPFLALLWANFHGGSSNLIYLFCFLFMIVGLVSFQSSKMEATHITKMQFIRFLIVGVLCMICICVNLHGFKMFIYPYQNMLDSTMLQNISEWRSTSFSDPFHYFYLIFLIFIFFTMLLSRKKIQFLHLVLFGVCTILGLKSIRFWFYTYIVMSYFIFDYVPKKKMEKGTEIGIVLLSILLCGLFATKAKNILSPTYYASLNKDDISMIQSVNPKRLFNMYDYGGELVYYHIPVFIDGRADLYSQYNYADYLQISKLEGDYVALIKSYSFDYFLVDKNYPIYTYLKYSDEYEQIYKNEDVILFQKKESIA